MTLADVTLREVFLADSYETEIDRLKARVKELEAAKSFAREIINAMWEGGCCDIDGGDVQEWATKHGLIVETVATADDIKGTNYYAEVGDPWFKYADWMEDNKTVTK